MGEGQRIYALSACTEPDSWQTTDNSRFSTPACCVVSPLMLSLKGSASSVSSTRTAVRGLSTSTRASEPVNVPERPDASQNSSNTESSADCASSKRIKWGSRSNPLPNEIGAPWRRSRRKCGICRTTYSLSAPTRRPIASPSRVKKSVGSSLRSSVSGSSAEEREKSGSSPVPRLSNDRLMAVSGPSVKKQPSRKHQESLQKRPPSGEEK